VHGKVGVLHSNLRRAALIAQANATPAHPTPVARRCASGSVPFPMRWRCRKADPERGHVDAATPPAAVRPRVRQRRSRLGRRIALPAIARTHRALPHRLFLSPPAFLGEAKRFVAKAGSLGAEAEVLPEDLSHEQINDLLGEPSAYTDDVEAFMRGVESGGGKSAAAIADFVPHVRVAIGPTIGRFFILSNELDCDMDDAIVGTCKDPYLSCSVSPHLPRQVMQGQ